MGIDALAALLNSLNGQVNGPEARHTFLANQQHYWPFAP